MVFTQLAKRAVRPVGGGREDVADLDLVVGDYHAVDEQFGELTPLLEGGGGEPSADGPLVDFVQPCPLICVAVTVLLNIRITEGVE